MLDGKKHKRQKKLQIFMMRLKESDKGFGISLPKILKNSQAGINRTAVIK
jgi:hypothetical protein